MSAHMKVHAYCKETWSTKLDQSHERVALDGVTNTWSAYMQKFIITFHLFFSVKFCCSVQKVANADKNMFLSGSLTFYILYN